MYLFRRDGLKINFTREGELLYWLFISDNAEHFANAQAAIQTSDQRRYLRNKIVDRIIQAYPRIPSGKIERLIIDTVTSERSELIAVIDDGLRTSIDAMKNFDRSINLITEHYTRRYVELLDKAKAEVLVPPIMESPYLLTKIGEHKWQYEMRGVSFSILTIDNNSLNSQDCNSYPGIFRYENCNLILKVSTEGNSIVPYIFFVELPSTNPRHVHVNPSSGALCVGNVDIPSHINSEQDVVSCFNGMFTALKNINTESPYDADALGNLLELVVHECIGYSPGFGGAPNLTDRFIMLARGGDITTSLDLDDLEAPEEEFEEEPEESEDEERSE